MVIFTHKYLSNFLLKELADKHIFQQLYRIITNKFEYTKSLFETIISNIKRAYFEHKKKKFYLVIVVYIKNLFKIKKFEVVKEFNFKLYFQKVYLKLEYKRKFI